MVSRMRIVIICSGDIHDHADAKDFIKEKDYIICADGGAVHASKMGIMPDVVLGDFDSIDPQILKEYEEKGIEIVRYPTNKDLTDAEIAVDLAISKHPDELVLLGADGSRLDHTLANVFLLRKLLQNGVSATIANNKNEIRLIDKGCTLNKKDGMKVSLIPVEGKVFGISTEGLKYKLENEVLSFGDTRGLSNEFSSNEAKISIQNGLLLVVMSKD